MKNRLKSVGVMTATIAIALGNILGFGAFDRSIAAPYYEIPMNQVPIKESPINIRNTVHKASPTLTQDTSINSIKNGERLLIGKWLTSKNKNYELAMQNDGNLVLYDLRYAKITPIWSSGTVGKHVIGVVMQADGNLVIYNINQQPIWSSQTYVLNSTLSNQLIIQNDGNVVIYRNSKPVWATNTSRK